MTAQNYTHYSSDNYHNQDMSRLPTLPEELRLHELSTPENPLATNNIGEYFKPYKSSWRLVE